MGYERNDRRWGGGSDRDYSGYSEGNRTRSYNGPARWEDDRARAYGDYGSQGGSSEARDYRGDRFNTPSRDYGRDRQGYSSEDRDFFQRAGDEVRSWFGDEEAERRRRIDEQRDCYADRGSYGASGYRSRHEHDPHYRSWRDRQMEALDRDYDEYHRENQGRFDAEFGSWRNNRQGQRELLKRVTEHQEVVGSDGEHIGTVDQVRGDRILLTKSDADAHGHHHSIPSSWITSVEDKVTVSKTADQAKQHWRDEERNRGDGLFGREDDRSVSLNRSFSAPIDRGCCQRKGPAERSGLFAPAGIRPARRSGE
jgi:hypothetical protein